MICHVAHTKKKEMNKEMVNHPSHYNDGCGIECIDAMRIAFSDESTADFCLINAFKYLWRYKDKNGTEDLNKASWYLSKFDELAAISCVSSGSINKSRILKELVQKALDSSE